MEYHVVFDATLPAQIGWGGAIAGAAIVAFSAAWVFAPKADEAVVVRLTNRPIHRLTPLTAAIVLAVAFLAASVGLWGDINKLERQLDRHSKAQIGGFPTVVGVVTDFSPAKNERGSRETFTVDGVPFSYSDYFLSGGFNQTNLRGGPMGNGLQVRILYEPMPYGNVIQRLEIAY